MPLETGTDAAQGLKCSSQQWHIRIYTKPRVYLVSTKKFPKYS